MKKTLTIKEALEAPRGFFPGVYLQEAAELIDEQKGLADEDEAQDIDFTTCPYWITTDDGQEPWGIADEDDFREWQQENL